MKQVLPGLAKRALAFMLAFVLLLSLVPSLPLAAHAAVQTDGWEYNDDYKSVYKTAEFNSADADLIFENDQPYDWQVKFAHIFGKSGSSISPTLTATVTDENGNTIGNPIIKDDNKLYYGKEYVILDASEFTALTKDLAGKFTLVMEMKNGSTFMARLTKTFSRKISVSIESSVSSRSNPDKVFTFADPIDLVLNIKQTSGVAAAYNAAVTVTNASGSELLAARGLTLPASTNITLSVKDLVNLPAITTAGAYKVNLTLTDSKGATQHQSSHSFSVVALKDNLTATITSPTSANMVFNDVTPDIVLNLQKTDGLAESFNAHILITNEKGTTALNGNFTANVPATGTATITPGMGNVKAVGTYTVVATITDDAGNYRGTATATFTIKSGTPMAVTVTNSNPTKLGNIYSTASGSDINMRLAITHKASANQTVTIKFVGTINGKECEQTITTTELGSTGYKTVSVTGKLMPYGVYENVALAVFDSYGNELWRDTKTYSFSRIPTANDPGDLPLMNMNVHFTNMDTTPMLDQIKLSAMAGNNMWRSTIRWETVEKNLGELKMTGDIQSVMEQTKSSGAQALIILAYGNDLYGKNDPDNDAWLAAYARYCGFVADQIARYYPNQVVGFEIWNEWNNSSMSKVPDASDRTGDKYAKVVIAASKAIRDAVKAVNNEKGTRVSFKIIGGVTSGDGSQTNTKTGEFIEAMLGTPGFLDAVDGISFHTYPSVETTKWTDKLADRRIFEFVSPAEYDFVSRLENFKGYLKAANAPDDLEIWLTETSWCTNEEREESTSDGDTHIKYGVTEEQAAAYMVQLYTWALADGSIDRIFWYDLLNDRDDDTKAWANNLTECNYGMLHCVYDSKGVPQSYSAKLGYVAMCALSGKLGNATYKGTVSLGDGVSAYKFTVGSKTVIVAWTNSATTKTLNCSGSMTVTDMYGNATSSLTSTTLSECPVYIEYSGTLSIG